MAGFPYSEIPHLITVGFGRQTLLGAADTLIDLVSREKLRHIFLVGGCDGARGERNYFTDFATSVPDDCLILTPPVVNTASTNWTLAISKGCRARSTPGSVMTLTRRLFWRSRWRRNWAVASTICRCRWCSLVRTESDRHPADAAVAGCEKHRHRSDGTGFFTPDLLAVLNEKFGLRSVTTVEQDMQQLLSA